MVTYELAITDRTAKLQLETLIRDLHGPVAVLGVLVVVILALTTTLRKEK